LPTDEHAAVFAAHRPAVVAAAYRVLGSRHDADDVAQDAYLRWADVDLGQVRAPRAYLVRTATRLALNKLREQSRRREDYVGPWLPEPVSTGPGADDALELAENVSLAMLVVLQSLSPLERAAFVLREVFDVSVPEIADTLDRSEAAVRQLLHRAREHVRARSPRRPVDRRTHEAVTQQFFAALMSGATDRLLAMMAPDVVLVTDGGGVKQAALRPIHGADKVARWLAGVSARGLAEAADPRAEFAPINGDMGVLAYDGDQLDGIIVLEVDGGLIRAIYAIRNPEKLAAVR
jgi:RNA polymerase sigma-70 factor, ECF subfamily